MLGGEVFRYEANRPAAKQADDNRERKIDRCLNNVRTISFGSSAEQPLSASNGEDDGEAHSDVLAGVKLLRKALAFFPSGK